MFLVIDIETVRKANLLSDLDSKGRDLVKKAAEAQNVDPDEFWVKRGAFYPELSTVVCVSMLAHTSESNPAPIMSSAGDNEKELLLNVKSALDMYQKLSLSGYNIKNFDIPFLLKRFYANGIPVPQHLLPFNKKPWEINHIDLMEWWKMGSYGQTASLDMACYSLGIESPKTEMDGSKVAEAYFRGQHEKIAEYCEQDVLSTYRLHCALTRIRPAEIKEPHRKLVVIRSDNESTN